MRLLNVKTLPDPVYSCYYISHVYIPETDFGFYLLGDLCQWRGKYCPCISSVDLTLSIYFDLSLIYTSNTFMYWIYSCMFSAF